MVKLVGQVLVNRLRYRILWDVRTRDDGRKSDKRWPTSGSTRQLIATSCSPEKLARLVLRHCKIVSTDNGQFAVQRSSAAGPTWRGARCDHDPAGCCLPD